MKTLSSLIFMALMVIGSAFADSTPDIGVPKYVQEEFRLTLTDEEIAVLKLYSKDVVSDLKETLEEASQKKNSEIVPYLKESIQKIVSENQTTANIFVRYALNRSLALSDILDKEDHSNSNVANIVQTRLMIQSLKIALLYAEFDFARYAEFELTTYSRFGADYFSLLNELSKSIVDASAQYKILITSLEFLQWDLYRELDNRKEAATITKIYYFLNNQPKKPMSDNEHLKEIRRIKQFITQLSIKPYLNTVAAHEVASLVQDAVAKNKDFDLQAPYVKGEEIILMDGYHASPLPVGQTIQTVTFEQEFYSTRSYIVYDSNLKKRMYTTDGEMFRTKGCLIKDKLCVGEPVATANDGMFTLIGVSKNGRALGINDKGRLIMGYTGLFYRRVGCDLKVNICVGDKVVRKYPKEDVKTITAIDSTTEGRYGLFLFGDSFYDDNFQIGSAEMFLGKL